MFLELFAVYIDQWIGAETAFAGRNIVFSLFPRFTLVWQLFPKFSFHLYSKRCGWKRENTCIRVWTMIFEWVQTGLIFVFRLNTILGFQYLASTRPRLRTFKIRLENEYRVGTPIRRNLESQIQFNYVQFNKPKRCSIGWFLDVLCYNFIACFYTTPIAGQFSVLC